MHFCDRGIVKLTDLADESTSTIFVGTRLESGTSVGAHV